VNLWYFSLGRDELEGKAELSRQGPCLPNKFQLVFIFMSERSSLCLVRMPERRK